MTLMEIQTTNPLNPCFTVEKMPQTKYNYITIIIKSTY